MKMIRKTIFILGLFISLTSCQSEPEMFEINKGFSSSFEYYKKHEFGPTIYELMVKSADENYERERRILYNAYEFNLNGNIKNLTGEKIDRAYLNVTIELKFKSGEIKLELKERIIYEGPSYSSWDEDTIKRIEESYFLNYNSNFSESLLNHSPEKVTLKCFITATNSVGLNIDILQIAEEDITAEWKKGLAKVNF